MLLIPVDRLKLEDVLMNGLVTFSQASGALYIYVCVCIHIYIHIYVPPHIPVYIQMASAFADPPFSLILPQKTRTCTSEQCDVLIRVRI